MLTRGRDGEFFVFSRSHLAGVGCSHATPRPLGRLAQLLQLPLPHSSSRPPTTPLWMERQGGTSLDRGDAGGSTRRHRTGGPCSPLWQHRPADERQAGADNHSLHDDLPGPPARATDRPATPRRATTRSALAIQMNHSEGPAGETAERATSRHHDPCRAAVPLGWRLESATWR